MMYPVHDIRHENYILKINFFPVSDCLYHNVLSYSHHLSPYFIKDKNFISGNGLVMKSTYNVPRSPSK